MVNIDGTTFVGLGSLIIANQFWTSVYNVFLKERFERWLGHFNRHGENIFKGMIKRTKDLYSGG